MAAESPAAIALETAALVGAAATGGIYLAFSMMVIPALRRCEVGTAVEVMQRVNELALRPPFMVLFFGGAAAAAGVALGEASTDRSLLSLAGAGLALASFVVTITTNVPHNTRLAAVAGGGPAATAAAAWSRFERGWTRANSVRGAASIGGALALAASLAR